VNQLNKSPAFLVVWFRSQNKLDIISPKSCSNCVLALYDSQSTKV